MRRDALPSAPRRAKIVAALRSLGSPGAREKVLRGLVALRRRPDAVVAFVLGAGVLAMILHWR